MLPRIALTTIVLIFCGSFGAVGESAPEEERAWEKVIQRFEAEDETTPPPAKPLLFTGSSSIVLWDVKHEYAEYNALNRGFGGSVFADLNYFFDRVVLPYKPRAIVVYSGDNDISRGNTPEEVIADFETFAGKVVDAFPAAPLILLAIKPSASRWELWPRMETVNAYMAAYAEAREHVHYVDTATPMLNADGEPEADYFMGDRLHLNDFGYAKWDETFRPRLEEILAPTAE